MTETKNLFTIMELRAFYLKLRAGMRLDAMAKQYGISQADAYLMYHAATHAWGKPGQHRQELEPPPPQEEEETIAAITQAPAKKPKPKQAAMAPIRKMITNTLRVPEWVLNGKRPPAEYSNRSPYGVARPGLSR
jgi:hypothetical protein